MTSATLENLAGRFRLSNFVAVAAGWIYVVVMPGQRALRSARCEAFCHQPQSVAASAQTLEVARSRARRGAGTHPLQDLASPRPIIPTLPKFSNVNEERGVPRYTRLTF